MPADDEADRPALRLVAALPPQRPGRHDRRRRPRAVERRRGRRGRRRPPRPGRRSDRRAPRRPRADARPAALVARPGRGRRDAPPAEDALLLRYETQLLAGSLPAQEPPELGAPTEARGRPPRRARRSTCPPGFEIQLVAAEPDIHKPMNIAFDDRGRLWVTETVEYPFPADRGHDAARRASRSSTTSAPTAGPARSRPSPTA